MAHLTGSSYAKIAVAVLIALLLFATAGLISCAGWDFRMGKGQNEMIGNASVPTQGIENIEIDWAAGSVDVIVSDKNEIELMEYSKGSLSKTQSMRWSVSGDTLKVDYGSWFSCLSLTSKSLEVHVPKALAAELGMLDIDGASGMYSVNGIACNKLKVHLASGEFNGSDIAAQQLDVDLASGIFDARGSFADSIRVQVASGNVGITSSEVCPHTIDADMASGNVVIGIPENDGFTARVDKASGSFQSEFETAMQGDNAYVYGDGSALFDVDIASGSFALQNVS